MFLGFVGDTHKKDKELIKRIVDELKVRCVDAILHCGDIEPEHLDNELFGNLPVYLALVDEQVHDKRFSNLPPGWTSTAPGERFVNIPGYGLVYLGHKKAIELVSSSVNKFLDQLTTISSANNDVCLYVAGHTHHQSVVRKVVHGREIRFINPGAVDNSVDGYEFAVMNTENGEIVFCRIPEKKQETQTFSVGVVSGNLYLSELSHDFWPRLVKEFEKRDATHIIYHGEIPREIIGHSAFEGRQVYYTSSDHACVGKGHDNWHAISMENPVVSINGFTFLVHPSLGDRLGEESEREMRRECELLTRQYKGINFVVCKSQDMLFEECKGGIRIISPGDVREGYFVVVCEPRVETTISRMNLMN